MKTFPAPRRESPIVGGDDLRIRRRVGGRHIASARTTSRLVPLQDVFGLAHELGQTLATFTTRAIALA